MQYKTFKLTSMTKRLHTDDHALHGCEVTAGILDTYTNPVRMIRLACVPCDVDWTRRRSTRLAERVPTHKTTELSVDVFRRLMGIAGLRDYIMSFMDPCWLVCVDIDPVGWSCGPVDHCIPQWFVSQAMVFRQLYVVDKCIRNKLRHYNNLYKLAIAYAGGHDVLATLDVRRRQLARIVVHYVDELTPGCLDANTTTDMRKYSKVMLTKGPTWVDSSYSLPSNAGYHWQYHLRDIFEHPEHVIPCKRTWWVMLNMGYRFDGMAYAGYWRKRDEWVNVIGRATRMVELCDMCEDTDGEYESG